MSGFPPIQPRPRVTKKSFASSGGKSRRLNKYYNDVVAELRALLDQSEEGGYIRPAIAPEPAKGSSGYSL